MRLAKVSEVTVSHSPPTSLSVRVKPNRGRLLCELLRRAHAPAFNNVAATRGRRAGAPVERAPEDPPEAGPHDPGGFKFYD